MNNIFLLTGPIRSGKTTALWDRFATADNASGFLTPDKEGLRCFYDLAGKCWLPFELPAESRLPAVEIGRFRFSSETFSYGKNLLSTAVPCDWFIADEAGRLEVEKGTGWEPALTTLIEDYKANRRRGNLLLVVRDSLVEQAVKKWALEGIPILKNPE